MVCHFIIQLCLHSLMFTHTYEDITETLKSYECLNILWRFVRNITFENSRNYPCLARSCTWYELSQFSWWFQFWNFIASPNEFSTNKNSRHLNEKRKKKYCFHTIRKKYVQSFYLRFLLPFALPCDLELYSFLDRFQSQKFLCHPQDQIGPEYPTLCLNHY